MNEARGSRQGGASWVQVHPGVVRITHWLNAVAIFIMVTSGWQIYNASPIWDFVIPDEITIGEWLAGRSGSQPGGPVTNAVNATARGIGG